MGQPKRMRDLIGVLKDKASLIKASLILSAKPTTSLHVAVLRATTHHPSNPPPDYTLDDVLAFGGQHRATASAVIDTVLGRLHRTQSAFVALKCLITLHHILRRGSPLLRDQFSLHPLLSLSAFRDASDADTLELSKWVRWYAQVIEQSIIASHSLGFFICSLPPSKVCHHQERRISVTRLMKELNSLVGIIEQICRAPDSLHYQRISMVYEVMKLVGEDYRITLREIAAKIAQLGGERIEKLSDEAVNELLDDLKRIEECKEKVFLMFLNKKKSDGTWDSIAELRREVEGVKQRGETLTLMPFQASELTRLEGPSSAALVPDGKKWLDVQWNPFLGPD